MMPAAWGCFSDPLWYLEEEWIVEALFADSAVLAVATEDLGFIRKRQDPGFDGFDEISMAAFVEIGATDGTGKDGIPG